MIKIIRYPSYIEIINAKNVPETERLRKGLSVWDKGKFCYTFSAIIEEEEKDKMYIPGGYDENLLFSYYPECEYLDKHLEFSDWKENPKISLKKMPRDEIQRKAISFLSNEKYSQKLLSLQTGLGKSYCTINYIVKTRKLPIVIVDSINTSTQWKDYVLEYTDISEDEIYILRGKSSVDKLLKMTEDELLKYKFFIGMYKTILSYFPERAERYNFFTNILKIGIKVYDEAHFYFKQIFALDCCSRCETIYLSATPKRENFSENKVYSKMFSTVGYYYHGFKTKYITTYLYYYDSNCPITTSSTFKTKRGFSVVSFNKYLQSMPEITDDVLLDLLKMIYNNNYTQKKKIFIVYGLIETTLQKAETIKNFLQSVGATDISVGVLNGTIKKSEKDKVFSSDIIVTTLNSFSKALDIKGGVNILINNVPISGDTPLNQLMGRLRYIPDENVYFIQTYDRSIKDLDTFIKNNINFYKKISKKIKAFNGIGINKRKDKKKDE